MSTILSSCRKCTCDSLWKRKRNIFSQLACYGEKAWERNCAAKFIRNKTFPIHWIEDYGFLPVFELLTGNIQLPRLTGDVFHAKVKFCTEVVSKVDDILNFPRARNLQQRNNAI